MQTLYNVTWLHVHRNIKALGNITSCRTACLSSVEALGRFVGSSWRHSSMNALCGSCILPRACWMASWLTRVGLPSELPRRSRFNIYITVIQVKRTCVHLVNDCQGCYIVTLPLPSHGYDLTLQDFPYQTHPFLPNTHTHTTITKFPNFAIIITVWGKRRQTSTSTYTTFLSPPVCRCQRHKCQQLVSDQQLPTQEKRSGVELSLRETWSWRVRGWHLVTLYCRVQVVTMVAFWTWHVTYLSQSWPSHCAGWRL